MDLSPLDRLTRKRNTLLQKQLDVQLQIIGEEYRMTKKDLDKGTKTLADFLMCLRHTAPGLQTYGQPDTRAMNAKSILLERRYDQQDETDGKKTTQEGKNSTSGNKVPNTAWRDKKRPQSSKERLQSSSSAPGNLDVNETDKLPEEDKIAKEKPSSAASYRNEFFNRRIVLDSRRRSFLHHCIVKDNKMIGRSGASGPDGSKPLTRATTHSGFYSNRDTRGEMRTTRPKSSITPRTHRPPTPQKYGREAETQVNEDSRKNVLKMFDVIFDPCSERPNGRIGKSGTVATPLYVPKDSEGTEAVVPSINLDSDEPQNESQTKDSRTAGAAPVQNGYVLNRRVAWSAPPKRREAVVTNRTSDASNDENNAPNRESMSVTPRSGMNRLGSATNIQQSPRRRPKSHTPKTSGNIYDDSIESEPQISKSPATPTQHKPHNQNSRPGAQRRSQQNNETRNGAPNMERSDSKLFTRKVITQEDLNKRAQRQRALGQMINSMGTSLKRPKTAPQPSYELMQRSVAAPRQQVAGILAEIQSRRADTRAMLTKSKQLKQMVHTLVPEDMTHDDSFSD